MFSVIRGNTRQITSAKLELQGYKTILITNLDIQHHVDPMISICQLQKNKSFLKMIVFLIII